MSSTTARPIVLDTNVLVAAAYAPESASRRIVESGLRGDLVLTISRDLVAEYQFILRRAVRRREYQQRLQKLLRQAVLVHPTSTPRVVPGDPDDDKFLAAAVAAAAVALVTNDHHLLSLDPYQGVRVIRPAAFVELFLEDAIP